MKDKDLVTGLILLLAAAACCAATIHAAINGQQNRAAVFGSAAIIGCGYGMVLCARKLRRR